MKKNNFTNSIQKGSFRHVVYQDGNGWCAVALEFNLVVTSDTPQMALFELYSAVAGYVEAVRLSKSRPFALNQEIDSEYQKLWDIATLKKTRSIKSPYIIHSYGESALV